MCHRPGRSPYNRRALLTTDEQARSAIADAARQLKRGRHRRAREICETVISDHPEHPGALGMLAIVSAAVGDRVTAIEYMRRAIAVVPGDARLHYDLGNLLLAENELQEAVVAFEAAVACDQNYADAWSNLGIALQTSGDIQAASQAFERALTVDPEHSGARMNRALALFQEGRFEDADHAFERLLAQQPDNIAVLTARAGTLKELERLDESFEHYRRALALNPADASIWNNFGIALQAGNRIDEAHAAYQKALEIAPAHTLAIANLATLLEKTHRLDEAEQIVRQGLEATPADPYLNVVLGKCLRRSGREEESATQLAAVLPITEDPKWRQALHYELGRSCDRSGDVERAYRHFAAATELAQKDWTSRDRGADPFAEFFSIMDTLLSREWVEGWTRPDYPLADPPPVFLVGFPRSGTTLLDQVLDAHPDIQVIEEQPIVDAVQGVVSRMPESYPQSLASLTDEELRDLRRCYLETASGYADADGGPYIVDKLPLNAVKALFIYRLFPEAKFVFALRHPRDVILSCFMQEFGLNHAMANFFTLEDTARFYSEVLSLWNSYEELLSMNVHYVRYESLVDDLPGEARRLLDFIGVAWNDSVLSFDQHARARGRINTPSYHQVSQPIYHHAKFRWPRYAGYLTNVEGTLKPFVERYGYDL